MILLAALVGAGCGTGRATYRPVLPRVTEGGGLRAEVIALDLPNVPDATRLSVALDAAEPPPGLMDARLAPAAAAPCTAGARPRLVAVDGQDHRERPVGLRAGGPQRLRLDYAGTELLDGSGGAVVDLVVAGGGGQRWHCLRLPLTGGDPRLGWRSSAGWALGGSLRLDGTIFGIVRLGRWVGPVRIGAEAGIGLTDCLVACPAKEPLLPAYRNYPTALTADVFPLRIAAFALGFEGAVETFWRSEQGDPASAVRVTVRLALAPPARNGLPRGPHMAFGSLDLATRVWLTRTGTEESGWVQMLGVTWDFGL
jgi:hypothetical protein